MVIVEHHDGGDNAGGHHEHDAVEIGTCKASIMTDNKFFALYVTMQTANSKQQTASKKLSLTCRLLDLRKFIKEKFEITFGMLNYNKAASRQHQSRMGGQGL